MAVKIKNRTGLNLVLGTVAVSFLLGFVWPWMTSSFSSKPAAVSTNSSTENQQVVSSQATAAASSLGAANVPPVPAQPKPTKVRAPVIKEELRSGTHNPYKKLMDAQRKAREKNAQRRKDSRQGQAGELDQTLKSIRGGEVAQGRLKKRNLYFEKLSQQLKDLQGKNQASGTKKKAPVRQDKANFGRKPESLDNQEEIEPELDDQNPEQELAEEEFIDEDEGELENIPEDEEFLSPEDEFLDDEDFIDEEEFDE